MSKALNKNDITMIKSMAAPPQLVKEELACAALLLGLSERQAKVCLSYFQASFCYDMYLCNTNAATGTSSLNQQWDVIRKSFLSEPSFDILVISPASRLSFMMPGLSRPPGVLLCKYRP